MAWFDYFGGKNPRARKLSLHISQLVAHSDDRLRFKVVRAVGHFEFSYMDFVLSYVPIGGAIKNC